MSQAATEKKKEYTYRVLERDITRDILILEIEYPPGVFRKVVRYLDEKVPKPDDWDFRMAAKWCWTSNWQMKLAKHCLDSRSVSEGV